MANWEQDLISEDNFFGIWGATVSETGDLFTYDEVKNQSVNFVWTVTESCEGDSNHWIAAPGFHVVNVLGYVLTQRSWDNTTPDAFYFFDDFDHSREVA